MDHGHLSEWRLQSLYTTEVNPPLTFSNVCPPPALSQTVASSYASRDLKLISPLLTNAKVIYHVTRRREFRIAVSLFTPPTLPEEMQMYVVFFLAW